MSYILDALKKADAQRERDPARGIHAQSASLSTGPRRPSDAYRAGFWGAGAAGLAAMAAVAWYLYQDRESVAVPAAPRVVLAPAPGGIPAPVSAPVAPPQAAVATVVLPPPAVVAANAPARDLRSSSQPRMRGRSQPVATAPTGVAAVGTTAVVAAAPPGPAVAASTAAAAARVTPPPPRAPVVVPTAPVVGLPADAPKVVITGGVYSTNPAHRMLIVNGQVFNQGADLGAGVTLEEIRPKAAVLMFRGGRYSVAY
jgi:general secretion pathway protein B